MLRSLFPVVLWVLQLLLLLTASATPAQTAAPENAGVSSATGSRADVHIDSVHPADYYFVQLGEQPPCLTPCKVAVSAGKMPVVVSGPGLVPYQRSAEIPSGVANLRIRPFTVRRAIAAASLGGTGLLLLMMGGAIQSPDAGIGLFTVGALASAAGIVVAATIRRGVFEIKQMSPLRLQLSLSSGKTGGLTLGVAGRF